MISKFKPSFLIFLGLLIFIFVMTNLLFISPSSLFAIVHKSYAHQVKPNLEENTPLGNLGNSVMKVKLDGFQEVLNTKNMGEVYINQVIYLNNQLAVDPLGIFGPTFGHTAIILVKSDGSGIYYSKGFTGASDWDVFRGFYVEGRYNKQNLTSDNMVNFMPGGSGVLPVGPNAGYQYTRYISIPVTEDMGNQMLKMAEMIYNSQPLIYNLYHDNCNQFVQQILEAAKIPFGPLDMIPNVAYKIGALIWPDSSGSYNLNVTDKIKIAASDISTKAVSGFGDLLNKINIAEPSVLQSQLSINTSQVALEAVASIPVPSKPSITSPYNWYQSIGESPMLMWQGDSNSTSYYVVVNSSNTGNVESGWINSTSWKPNLPNQNYIYSWKVKARNTQGAEGPWSDESHFSTASTTLAFEGNISFSPPSPSSADQIKIFASTTGWGGVGITLRVSVNNAPDGSTNGEWRVLKELGVPKFNENDAPVWNTNGWQNGAYRIRVEAKGPGDPNWQNPAVIDGIYELINKPVITTTEHGIYKENNQADLIVSDIKFYNPYTTNEVTPQPGSTVTAFAVLKNNGTRETGIFNVKWYLDGKQVGYGSHASLKPGEVSNDNIRYNWNVTSGNHTLKFVADCDNHVIESNESNNSFTVSVSVDAATESSIRLEIIYGPVLVGQVTIYRVEAIVTGVSPSTVTWNRDDQNGNLGANISEIQLLYGETFVIEAKIFDPKSGSIKGYSMPLTSIYEQNGGGY